MIKGRNSHAESCACPHRPDRNSLNDDATRPDYRLTVTDPNTYTEPIEVGRHREWRPEIELSPYNCQKDQGFGQELEMLLRQGLTIYNRITILLSHGQNTHI